MNKSMVCEANTEGGRRHRRRFQQPDIFSGFSMSTQRTSFHTALDAKLQPYTMQVFPSPANMFNIEIQKMLQFEGTLRKDRDCSADKKHQIAQHNSAKFPRMVSKNYGFGISANRRINDSAIS